jgi:hypothetical protein
VGISANLVGISAYLVGKIALCSSHEAVPLLTDHPQHEVKEQGLDNKVKFNKVVVKQQKGT